MKGLEPTTPPHGSAFDPVESTLGYWKYFANLAELWWSRHGGVPAEGIARARLAELVAFARERSPFYRRRYAALPAAIASTSLLPPVTRAELMDGFDDVCTDRAVRRADVERFVADRGAVGRLFLGRYPVWKSSGTSGTPGIFVQDAQAMAAYEALVAAQLEWAPVDPARFVAGGGRSALVIATGDHYASITAWERVRRAFPAATARSFPVLAPLAELVGELNRFQPAHLASYPSVLALLAAEQRAGRLAIAPALAWSGGETLTPRMHEAIEQAFGCPVINEYGSSECLAIAHGCRERWLHVNAEWVILEPVDAAGRPIAPGETSHTVLVTNLANRVQPILRYDLGDRVTLAAGPCACRNPLPAFRVAGRSGATLAFRAADGSTVPVPPLALETAAEIVARGARFQLVRIAPDRLAVRVDPEAARAGGAGRRIVAAIRQYLAAQSLANVSVTLSREAPRVDRASGKLASVTVEAPCPPTSVRA
ncbi:MAG TPA: AMP-binding protein [Usitatibacter sp.]|nr:AMP-binding protein [Usitatibacter sp.]